MHVTGRLLQDLLAYTRSHFAAEELMLDKGEISRISPSTIA